MERNRAGWPVWAVSAVACANCGRIEFHWKQAPHQTSVHFEPWVQEVMPFGRTMHTRVGFKVWCTSKCQTLWERANARLISPAFAPDTAYNRLRRDMHRRSQRAAEYQGV